MEFIHIVCVFVLLHETFILCERLPCQPKRHRYELIENTAVQDSEVLSCLPNFGLEMCTDLCERTTNCSYVDYSMETLLCSLIKIENAFASKNTSAFNRTESIPVAEGKSCGSTFCADGSTCVSFKHDGQFCVDLVDLTRKCCTDRYLVTGKYGVKKDRVSFSSVRNDGPHVFTYQLDSDHGWVPAHTDQHQWIQVLFYRRKLVSCVVTRGLPHGGYNMFVTKYHLKFLSMTEKWLDVLDETGNPTFAGNVDGFTDRRICPPHPIRTAGIRLIPVEWSNEIVLRFDVLGC